MHDIEITIKRSPMFQIKMDKKKRGIIANINSGGMLYISNTITN